MWSEVSETLLERLRADARVRTDLDALEADVIAGRTSPTAAARLLLDRFCAPDRAEPVLTAQLLAIHGSLAAAPAPPVGPLPLLVAQLREPALDVGEVVL